MNLTKNTTVKKAEGKLGIVIPGIGAVSTTLMAGVFLCRKGLSVPKGSVTQMGKIKLKEKDSGGSRFVSIKDFVPLAKLDDIEFGGWDIFSDTAYEAAMKASVLRKTIWFRFRTSSKRLNRGKPFSSRNS